MSFVKAIATVGGLTLASRIAGFARDIIMAIILGAGPLADAFFIALKIPNIFRRITAEGAMSIAFVPIFSETLEKEGKEAAQKYAQRMLAFLYFTIIPLSVVAIYFMPHIINVIAPGFDGDSIRYRSAIELTRITFPYLLFISLTALIGGMLNTHNRYAPFAAAPIIFNFCLLIALFCHSFFAPTPAHALAMAVLFSGVLQFLWVLFFIRKCGYRLRFSLPALTPRTRKTLRLMGPAVMGAGVMHINLFVDVMLGSLLPAGSISYLYYADRLAQLPLGVIGIAIGTALLPMLSKTIAAHNVEEGKKLFAQAIRYSTFFSLPAAMALVVLAFPIIYTLFSHGNFGFEDARMSAYVLMAYALGLPAYIACKTYASTFYAQQDTKTPLIMSSISAASNIGLSLILIQYWGVFGLAFATSLAGWIQLLLLLWASRKRDVSRLGDGLVCDILRIVIASEIMALVLHVAFAYVIVEMPEAPIARVMVLSLLIAAGLVIYGSLTFAMKIVKFQELKALLKRQKRV